MSYAFNQKETSQIIQHFGGDFYEKIVRDLETYAVKWSLSDIQLIPSYSASLVFQCRSVGYGKAVLKFGNPAYGGIRTECSMLLQYNGNRFCKVLEADMENAVLLERCVEPGIPLRDESSLEKRLSVFCSLYQGLHMEPDGTAHYPSYTEWVGRITEYMSKKDDAPELYSHMQKAREICLSVAAEYPGQMLLHGDLHHDNILLDYNGQYVIIDPKGVTGDPVFDIPRFILNEFGDDITPELFYKLKGIAEHLAQELDIPVRIIKQCLYVETAMGKCWQVESGAKPEEYAGLLEHLALAERILNS
jgi:streptomycin 6-kinase